MKSKQFLRFVQRSFLVVFLFGCNLELALASETVVNRNDVFKVLGGLQPELQLSGLDIWVNTKQREPVVNVGDAVYFTMQSDDPAYYTIIYVDSKGGTSVLLPMSSSGSQKISAKNYVVFPPLTDACDIYEFRSDCFDKNNQFEQGEPIGKDTVFLIASELPISSEVLGAYKNEDFVTLGKNLKTIETLVQRINNQAVRNPFSLIKYAYAVESSETQYTTRAIGRKVKEMEKLSEEIQPKENEDIGGPSLIFNNINFAYNSTVLTLPGKRELDGLGSALVEMQEENGKFPLLELTGHTDSIGSAVFNNNLSARRAESAKLYLVLEHGVTASQILTVGAGELFPQYSNDDETGRALNRRVEFSILPER